MVDLDMRDRELGVAHHREQPASSDHRQRAARAVDELVRHHRIGAQQKSRGPRRAQLVQRRKLVMPLEQRPVRQSLQERAQAAQISGRGAPGEQEERDAGQGHLAEEKQIEWPGPRRFGHGEIVAPENIAQKQYRHDHDRAAPDPVPSEDDPEKRQRRGKQQDRRESEARRHVPSLGPQACPGGGATLSTSSSVVRPIATFIAPLMRSGFMPSLYAWSRIFATSASALTIRFTSEESSRIS